MLDSFSIDNLFIEIYENHFSDLISCISMYMCLGFLFLQTETYIKIILRAVTLDATWCKDFIQAYCD